MHNIKVHIKRLHTMERKKLIVACSIVLLLGVTLVSAAIWASSILQPAREAKTTVSLSGEIVCLPHKGSPSTQECALGLHADDNRYYSVKNSATIRTMAVGTRVTLKGILTNETSDTYDIVGTLDAAEIVR